jgi:hypothetical protein
MEHIYITGTGRSGTTFLIKLFTFLNLNTGFTKETYNTYIYKNCSSGMEKQYNDIYTIIKNPNIIENIENIIKDDSIKIKKIIIPIRNYKSAAISRVNHGKDNGGLWNATDEESQINFYYKLIANYIYYMTKYNIDTIFLDFDQIISDKVYLYTQLKCILDEYNIHFDTFSSVYDEINI